MKEQNREELTRLFEAVKSIEAAYASESLSRMLPTDNEVQRQSVWKRMVSNYSEFAQPIEHLKEIINKASSFRARYDPRVIVVLRLSIPSIKDFRADQLVDDLHISQFKTHDLENEMDLHTMTTLKFLEKIKGDKQIQDLSFEDIVSSILLGKINIGKGEKE